MTGIDERKNIIVSLKSYYFGQKKGIDKKIQYLKFISSINFILTLFCVVALLAAIVSDFLGLDFLSWEKMGLLTILCVSSVLTLPIELYELQLLNHFKKIHNGADFKGIEKLNNELKSIIRNLNNRLKNNWIIILLVILILIMGAWQALFDISNPYWEYMKIPTIIFFGITITRFIIINKKLSQNIIETEKHCC